MAIEKILNTRILMKVDTLENWGSSTIGLKKGELAFATVAATAGNGLSEPVVMVKIGEDGVKTFKDLPWNFYAKASDVIAAAKSEASLKSFINGVIADAGIATDEALQALVGRVGTAEGKISTAEGKISTAEGEIDTLQSEMDAVEAKAAANEAAIGVLNGNAETSGSVAKSIADAIAALNLGNTYEAKGTAQNLINGLDVDDTAVTGKYVSAVSETDGKISVTRADLPTYTLASGSANGTVAFNGADVAVKGLGSAAYTDSKSYDAAGSAAAVLGESGDTADKNTVYGAKAAAAAAAQAAQNAQNTANGKIDLAGVQALNYATKSEAEGYANAKDGAIAEAKKAGTDAAAALESYKSTNDAAVALKADKSALEDEIERAKAAEKANADAIERLTNGVSQDEIDGVNDLINYVKTHGPEVTGMKEDIADNAKAIADEAKRAGDEEARLAGLISDNAEAIEGLLGESGSVAKAEDADKLGGTVAADYLKKSEAPGYGDILTKTSAATLYQPVGQYATAAQGAKADTAVQPAALNDYYTKTAADAEFMNSTETNSAIDAKITALNLGSTYEPIGAETRAKAYADGLAGNYATAAQGAKADSAVQSVVTGATNGTISVDGTEVAVAGLGSAAYTNSSAYATAAQGNTADQALSLARSTAQSVGALSNGVDTINQKLPKKLEEITTTANGGLKVTDKNHIDIDDSVTFVFNCGTASEVI